MKLGELKAGYGEWRLKHGWTSKLVVRFSIAGGWVGVGLLFILYLLVIMIPDIGDGDGDGKEEH